MLTEVTSRENFAFVKDSFFKFISSRIPHADLSGIDDIILSYVYATFEGGTEEFYSQLNDIVVDFTDMMAAYVPDFNRIETDDICNWMIDIAHCLGEMAAAKANEEQEEDKTRSEENGRPAPVVATSTPEKHKKGTRTNSTSEDEKEARPEKAITVFYENELCYLKCHLLHEMFPGTNPMEVKHCLSISFGDTDEAAAALMHRRDSGQALELSTWQAASKVEAVDDKVVKHRVIARYSYVDKEPGVKEHKPIAPKHVPKKLVRYRDNKIVSLKGERYTEEPKNGVYGFKKNNKKHHP